MASWLNPDELRVGLGCMRLEAGDFEAVVRAAVVSGITVFDTARAYGDNERRLAEALKASGSSRARIVTKGGMRRPEGRWQPDGRGVAIRADCEASLEALDGIPIDLYLLHAPDPRTSFATSVRALAGLLEAGLVRRIGLSNVNRRQLDEALELAPISAVEVALSLFDDEPLRGGVVARCAEKGLAVIAHSPLGGVAKAPALSRDAALAEEAARLGATPQELALAVVLDAAPCVVAIPGARRPETVRSAARAAKLRLDEQARLCLRPRLAAPSLAPRAAPESTCEVVLIMGLPGSGKSEAAEAWVARGHERLNRDARGGSLRDITRALEERLAAGARAFVLDNTYVTRAQRRDVIQVAHAHGARVRGSWLDVPMPQAQVNVVLRMLEAHGRLLEPEELRRGKGPTQLSPNSLFRIAREVEPPDDDEGFDALERVAFQRRPAEGGAPARLIAYDAVLDDSGQPVPGAQAALGAPELELKRLVFGWKPDADTALLERAAASLATNVRLLHCPHPAGPPVCWCRPPLPGLPLRFAREEGVDLSRSVLVGVSAAHRALASALGCAYEDATGRRGA